MSVNHARKGWDEERAQQRRQLLHMHVSWHVRDVVAHEQHPSAGAAPAPTAPVAGWMRAHPAGYAALLARVRRGDSCGVYDVTEAEHQKETTR